MMLAALHRLFKGKLNRTQCNEKVRWVAEATLSAHDEGGDTLAEVRVAPSFKLSRSSAVAWAESGFAEPR